MIRSRRVLFLIASVLAACVFDTRFEDPTVPGYVRFQINLRPTTNTLFKRAGGAGAANGLGKTASADTIFSLDSLKIILTASGTTTITKAYVLAGRADAGNLVVNQRIDSLPSLRKWTARILGIDTTLNPTRSDTVYNDTVSFTVRPSDTTVVTKTVNPAFSILRVRFWSTDTTQVTNYVKYVRIRVDATLRDSTAVGPGLRAVSYGNASTGIAVGDSGLILRTTNSGTNWTSIGTTNKHHLNGVNCPGTNTCWAVGDSGTVWKTTNGTTWTAQAGNTTKRLNAVEFGSTALGWAVGDTGTIINYNNPTWSVVATTGTSQSLYGVYMISANANNGVGVAVGKAGAVVRTANGGSTWTLVTNFTSANLRAVVFFNSTLGFAVGDGGVIFKSRDAGLTWTSMVSHTTNNLNGVFFKSATVGWAVGDNGVVVATADSATWAVSTSVTLQNLKAVGMGGSSPTTGVAVGDRSTFLVTTNSGGAWTRQIFGDKSFDQLLTYKYLTPGVSHTLLLQAIDTLGGTLRGYEVTRTVNLSAGKDSTLTPSSSLTKCGYSGFSACTP